VPERVAALPTVPEAPTQPVPAPVATPPAATPVPGVTFGIEKEAPGAAPHPATASVAVSRAGGQRTVTVQPGDSLWTIAQATLGDGDAWEDIYRANRSQIRNPRWVYPGQVLVIPNVRR
jgi:nucleoid-associated protein YgaU